MSKGKGERREGNEKKIVTGKIIPLLGKEMCLLDMPVLVAKCLQLEPNVPLNYKVIDNGNGKELIISPSPHIP